MSIGNKPKRFWKGDEGRWLRINDKVACYHDALELQPRLIDE